MRNHFLFTILLCFSLMNSAYAVQATITDAEGYSCMGDDKSRKQTEQAAMVDAKNNAAEYTCTYIKTETRVKDFALQKDVVSAYTNAEVTVLEDLEKGWYKDPSAGDCYKIKIKAEVTPDQQAMERIALASASSGTSANISVPVAPPPLPGSGTLAAQGTATAPDVVVVPSGITYVYMVPSTTGVYFYNGSWYRYYEGYWFQSPTYGRSWMMVNPVIVPRSVVNVPPEYPRHLPPTYARIHFADVQQHWQAWDRTREWNKHDWFNNETKVDTVQRRQALIEQEREEHSSKRDQIRQARELQYLQQQSQRRIDTERSRQVVRQEPRESNSREPARIHQGTDPSAQHNQKADKSNLCKGKEKRERARRAKKEKKESKAKQEHREKKAE